MKILFIYCVARRFIKMNPFPHLGKSEIIQGAAISDLWGLFNLTMKVDLTEHVWTDNLPESFSVGRQTPLGKPEYSAIISHIVTMHTVFVFFTFLRNNLKMASIHV